MGLFTDRYITTYKEHTIEIEARVINLIGTAQYDLILDNKRIDRVEGMHGTFFLRGQIDESPSEEIKVQIKQSLGTKYQLFIDDNLISIQKA